MFTELFYGEVLQTEPFVRFSGAQRVVAIDPLDCQVQSWNDDLGSEEEAQEPPVDPNGAEDVLTGSYRTRGLPE
jgi:hypothetical protein